MKILTAIIFISFLGILFLGFVPVHTSHSMHLEGEFFIDCPIAAIMYTACISNGTSMALLHLSVFQSLSSVPLVIILFAIGLCLVVLGFFSPPRIGKSFKYASGKLFFLPQRHLQSWLSLLEHSPSLA